MDRQPGLWVSDQPLSDAAQQWARLHAMRDRTGLWPVLLGRIEAGQQRPPPWSCDPRELDALDAEAILQDKWQHLVRLHQQTMGRLWMAVGPQGMRIVDAPECPEGFQPLPEGVRVLDCWTTHYEGEERVVFVDERGRRFVTWPGLAPPPAAGRDPDVVAREVVASKLFPACVQASRRRFLGWCRSPAAPTSPPSWAGWRRPATSPATWRSRRCCAPGSNALVPRWWHSPTASTCRWPPRPAHVSTPSTPVGVWWDD